MSITYRETFNIPGLPKVGIEDFEQEGDHFFPEDYASGKAKRFQLWCGGGGFGQASHIDEARAKVHAYAAQRLTREITQMSIALALYVTTNDQLGGDVFNLARFRVNE
jgi:hypothetical protein